jgi:Domain of unknown function (DUF5615)
MLAFYMDQHVRAEITQGLRRRGIDVLTAFEDGAAAIDDELLLIRATALARILVTQDYDFLGIVSHWQRTSREFPGIVFAIQERIDIGRMIEYLELIAQLKTADEMRNQVEYVPMR